MSDNFVGIDLGINRETGSTIALFGASKQGKTTAIIWLYHKFYEGKGYITILCSPTLSADIYEFFPTNIIRTTNYETCVELIKAARTIQLGTNNRYKFLFIIDDVVTAKSDKTLRQMITTMRNLNISTIISLQYQKLLDIANRVSVNSFLFFHYGNKEAADYIVSNFIGEFLHGFNKTQKTDSYQKITEDHRFIAFNALENTCDIGIISKHYLDELNTQRSLIKKLK